MALSKPPVDEESSLSSAPAIPKSTAIARGTAVRITIMPINHIVTSPDFILVEGVFVARKIAAISANIVIWTMLRDRSRQDPTHSKPRDSPESPASGPSPCSSTLAVTSSLSTQYSRRGVAFWMFISKDSWSLSMTYSDEILGFLSRPSV